MDRPADRFAVTLEVLIRPCRERDLPALEWFGLFASHRGLVREVFDQQQRGDALMLVAQVNGQASGQAWIDFARLRAEARAVLWAVRLMPCLQGRGIGTRLLGVAEAAARERGAQRLDLAVETDNPRARRFYERLGYLQHGTVRVDHLAGRLVSTQWLLAKQLHADHALGAAP